MPRLGVRLSGGTDAPRRLLSADVQGLTGFGAESESGIVRMLTIMSPRSGKGSIPAKWGQQIHPHRHLPDLLAIRSDFHPEFRTHMHGTAATHITHTDIKKQLCYIDSDR